MKNSGGTGRRIASVWAPVVLALWVMVGGCGGGPAGSNAAPEDGSTTPNGAKRVTFSPGSDSAVLEGSVIRGERHEYLLGARAGQQMTVRISTLEDNAVFQIYEPGRDRTLPGAGERDDARAWSGELPTSGDYTVVVGGTRGNATYKLRVTIM